MFWNRSLSNSVEFEELVEKDIVVTERINTQIENITLSNSFEFEELVEKDIVCNGKNQHIY